MANRAQHIEWEYFDQDNESVILPGTYISAEAGGLPIYRVMALSNGRAWLRDVLDGHDRVTPLSRFHWRVCNPGAWANTVSDKSAGL